MSDAVKIPQKITFTLARQDAQRAVFTNTLPTVRLAGSFEQPTPWAGSYAMQPEINTVSETVMYSATLLLALGQQHFYKFIVDDEWQLDAVALVRGEKLVHIDATGNTNHVLDFTEIKEPEQEVTPAPSFKESDFAEVPSANSATRNIVASREAKKAAVIDNINAIPTIAPVTTKAYVQEKKESVIDEIKAIPEVAPVTTQADIADTKAAVFADIKDIPTVAPITSMSDVQDNKAEVVNEIKAFSAVTLVSTEKDQKTAVIDEIKAMPAIAPVITKADTQEKKELVLDEIKDMPEIVAVITKGDSQEKKESVLDEIKAMPEIAPVITKADTQEKKELVLDEINTMPEIAPIISSVDGKDETIIEISADGTNVIEKTLEDGTAIVAASVFIEAAKGTDPTSSYSDEKVTVSEKTADDGSKFLSASIPIKQAANRESMDEASSYDTAQNEAVWSRLSTEATVDGTDNTILADSTFDEAVEKKVVYDEQLATDSIMSNTVVVCGDLAADAVANGAESVLPADASEVSKDAPTGTTQPMDADDLMLPMSLPAFLQYSQQNSLATIDSQGQLSKETSTQHEKVKKPSRFQRIKSFFKPTVA